MASDERSRVKIPHVPCLRAIDADLRRKRIIAARHFAARSIPRIAILLGQWDAGEIVRLGLKPTTTKKEREHAKRKRKDANSNGRDLKPGRKDSLAASDHRQ